MSISSSFFFWSIAFYNFFCFKRPSFFFMLETGSIFQMDHSFSTWRTGIPCPWLYMEGCSALFWNDWNPEKVDEEKWKKEAKFYSILENRSWKYWQVCMVLDYISDSLQSYLLAPFIENGLEIVFHKMLRTNSYTMVMKTTNCQFNHWPGRE